jgi:hypothetical protein
MRFALTAVVSSLLISGAFGASAMAGVAAPAADGAKDPVQTTAPGLSAPLFQPIATSNKPILDYTKPLHELDTPIPAGNDRLSVPGPQRKTEAVPPVEPIPSPSAVASGLVALAALAAARLLRRFKPA